ncbi:uncharacterized protein LOC131249115 [Magnolia sinica]|uniref:uncharacterized protein LOC131249115 n=1 Tax=Magnolia sinica TaxID=86752 RepID=UPI0026596497|nr:uncharacterized protein LOC131249115 [Magnolia sinica]
MPDFIQEDHGTAIDKRKNRIRCKYCTKVVTSFNRLMHHLGGVRGDVVPCEQVPTNVKVLARDTLLKRRKQRLVREFGQLDCPNDTLRRNSCSGSTESKSTKPDTLGKGKKAVYSVPKDGAAKDSINNKLEDSSRNALRCIARFFYDVGVDFDAAKSPYLQQMLDAAAGCGGMSEVPSYHELRGWILQEEVEETREHVKAVKRSWERTGCSILLDGWTDEKGRSLINFLADCPKGVVFLRSVDASDSIGDVEALFSLFNGVIEEVGVENVVQVITYNASCCMVAVGKRIMEKHRTIFWTVCAVHCLGLMLEEIGMMGHVMKVLNKAKTITRFIYSRSSVLKLMKKHTCGRDIVQRSKTNSAMPFLTLESIVAEKESLKNMFSSSTWNTSIWASRTEGRRIAELIQDLSFWTGAEEALNATVPLLCVLRLIDRAEKPLVGYIYETMDQAKERIRKNFKDKKGKYLPFWKIIDAIWDNHLHSPLHSAGYFLNPSLFYSSEFCADAEVASGLLCCIVRMVKDQHVHDLIVLQLEVYRAAMGDFSKETAINNRRKTTPDTWWSLHGGHCPELQRLAIRILSQTGSRALKCDLKRSLTEQLHKKGRNGIEQRRLVDLEFVHYNLRLRHPPLVSNKKDNFVLEGIDAMDDWVLEAQEQAFGIDDSNWMDVVGDDVNIEEKAVKKGSSIQVKEELQ